MNTKELIELAMKQQASSDKMMELLSVFKGIEEECNNSKEMMWSKIYLLGFEMGKQEGADFTMELFELVSKFRKLKPEYRSKTVEELSLIHI